VTSQVRPVQGFWRVTAGETPFAPELCSFLPATAKSADPWHPSGPTENAAAKGEARVDPGLETTFNTQTPTATDTITHELNIK